MSPDREEKTAAFKRREQIPFLSVKTGVPSPPALPEERRAAPLAEEERAPAPSLKRWLPSLFLNRETVPVL